MTYAWSNEEKLHQDNRSYEEGNSEEYKSESQYKLDTSGQFADTDYEDSSRHGMWPGIPASWILLNSQYTVDVLCNEKAIVQHLLSEEEPSCALLAQCL